VALLRLEERLEAHPVTVDLPPDLPLLPIDEILIEQVFINLLENAARYTPPGTEIAIAASHLDGEVVIEVADNGPGVPPGSEEMVFRKFYRATVPLASVPSAGAGLGLTISRGIVTAHGGRMWVEQRLGGGARFRFTVPLAGPEISPLPMELSAGPSNG
jgi:two-component system, OmpR family, sensor histidine kinase KdpD